jgi:hypothetical protein
MGAVALAEQLLANTIAKQNIDRDTLSIHADNVLACPSCPSSFVRQTTGSAAAIRPVGRAAECGCCAADEPEQLGSALDGDLVFGCGVASAGVARCCCCLGAPSHCGQLEHGSGLNCVRQGGEALRHCRGAG